MENWVEKAANYTTVLHIDIPVCALIIETPQSKDLQGFCVTIVTLSLQGPYLHVLPCRLFSCQENEVSFPLTTKKRGLIGLCYHATMLIYSTFAKGDAALPYGRPSSESTAQSPNQASS